MLEDDVDIRNFGNDAHEHRDVRVPQNALHDDLILNFLQQLVGQARVEYLFNCHRRAVQQALVDSREATLTNLFAYLQIGQCDLAHSRHGWQSSRADRHVGGLRERLEVLLLNLVPQIFNFVEQSFLVFALIFELLLHFSYLGILRARRHGTLESLTHSASSGRAGCATELSHPVSLVVGYATAGLEGGLLLVVQEVANFDALALTASYLHAAHSSAEAAVLHRLCLSKTVGTLLGQATAAHHH